LNSIFPTGLLLTIYQIGFQRTIFRHSSIFIGCKTAIHHHPERGLFLDTAPDPVQALFTPLPRTSIPLHEACQQYAYLNDWYPCSTRAEMIGALPFQSLATYVLYDVTIGKCEHRSASISSSKEQTIHYNEYIYLFDSRKHLTNMTSFVRHILPRFVRLLALVPNTSMILLPYLNTKQFIRSYIDILMKRGLLSKNQNRFIEYNASVNYHGNAVYSTISPRSDLLLLNRVLSPTKDLSRRELILIIYDKFDDISYDRIIQTIHQFDLPADFEYLTIYEYKDTTYNLTKISDLFSRSLIVIGKHTDILSHIVWCRSGTHIIEIAQTPMTTVYYEMSIELHLTYWLAMTNRMNQIDTIDFRNLMLKLLTNIDV
jgi:hypothetical protein